MKDRASLALPNPPFRIEPVPCRMTELPPVHLRPELRQFALQRLSKGLQSGLINHFSHTTGHSAIISGGAPRIVQMQTIPQYPLELPLLFPYTRP